MQNHDWNKCFQQVRDVELHFPFVRGLAVGPHWGCLRPTTQRAAQPRAPRARLTGRLLGRCAGSGGAAATAREPGPSSAQVEPGLQGRPPKWRGPHRNSTTYYPNHWLQEERPLEARSLSPRLRRGHHEATGQQNVSMRWQAPGTFYPDHFFGWGTRRCRETPGRQSFLPGGRSPNSHNRSLTRPGRAALAEQRAQVTRGLHLQPPA